MTVKKRVLVILIPVLLVLAGIIGFVFLRAGLSAKVPAVKKTAEHRSVYFGTYPQTKVTDEALIADLNKLELKWQSFGYYYGNTTFGSAKQSDYAKYADIVFEGEKYRAIKYSAYRPTCTTFEPKYSWLPERIKLNQAYWFKYEPIEWVVLSEDEHLLMSKMLLDSQPINNVVYSKTPELGYRSELLYKDSDCRTLATDYATSDIRAWLNNDFFKTAFSAEEAQRVVTSRLDNTTWSGSPSKYDSPSTDDKVFLLSYNEMINPAYGFEPMAEKEDALRTAFGTDYAFLQGMCTLQDLHNEGVTWWWLRTASGEICKKINAAGDHYGSIRVDFVGDYFPDHADSGIRPALRLDSLDK